MEGERKRLDPELNEDLLLVVVSISVTQQLAGVLTLHHQVLFPLFHSSDIPHTCTTLKNGVKEKYLEQPDPESNRALLLESQFDGVHEAGVLNLHPMSIQLPYLKPTILCAMSNLEKRSKVKLSFS